MTELPVQLDPARVPSPCYVVDTQALEKNLEVLSYVQQESGAKILLALKAFAMHALFPRIRRHLVGICASGPWEAQLGREEFCLDGHEVHTFSPAYSQQDMQVALRLSDHVVCNSWQQWQMLRELAQQNPEIAGQVDFGIRVNPEHSEGQVPLYDPCAPYSRLGITEGGLRRALKQDAAGLDGLSGLHFHTLCEQGADALQRTLVAVEERFADIIEGMQWLNLGGGHHITRPGYDLDL
ncbi:MAG: carboxynorspermidine decarboxylase, partial [Spirochaetaceae bacterium]